MSEAQRNTVQILRDNFDPGRGDLLFMIVSAGGPVVRTVERVRAELATGQRPRTTGKPGNGRQDRDDPGRYRG